MLVNPMPHVLVPAYTVADWGGLHENVYYTIRAFLDSGMKVTAVVKPGLFAEKLGATGADIIEVDWDNWEFAVPKVLLKAPYDVILTQPFRSRQLALKVSDTLDTPVIAMFHGFNHDYVYMWQNNIEHFIVTADVLKHFLVQYCRLPSEKISVIPNGIPDARFEYPPITREERLSQGVMRILMASRLTPDKRSQVSVLKRMVKAASDIHKDIQISVNVLGGGPEEDHIASVLEGLHSRYPNVDGRMHGWIPAETLPQFFNRAYFAIMAGRGGLQSMVSGTPTIGAGARGIVGPAWGESENTAVSSNLGDYPIESPVPWNEYQVIEELANESRFQAIQSSSRAVLEDRKQSLIDRHMTEIIRSVTDSS